MRTLVTLAGAVLGAVGLSILHVTKDFLFRIPETRDGLYWLVVFWTLPIGAILGGMTALGVLDRLRGKRREAEMVWLFGGLAVAAVCVYQGWHSGQYGGPLRNLLVYAGLPLGWSVLLVWRAATRD